MNSSTSGNNGGYWSGLLQNRNISRRRMLGTAAGVGLGAAALSLVGCGSDDGGSGEGLIVGQRRDTTREARPGGTMAHYATADATNFDPIAATANIDRGHAQYSYSRLFKWKPGIIDQSRGEIEGDVVDSWEINLDALQITMKLRPNAGFDPRPPTSGRMITSEDIKFSFDKFKAQSIYRRDWFQEISPAAPFGEVTTPDRQTVVLKLAYPLGAAFDFLANPLGMYAMPVEADGGFDPRREMRGTGPWIMDNYRPSIGFEYKKNPHFYIQIQNRPFFDGWSRPIVSEYAQQLAQFKAGNLWMDVVRQEDIIQTKRDHPEITVLQGEWGATAPGVFFGWLSPFKDERLRRAVSMLIDREAFATAYSDADRFAAEGIDLQLVYDNFLGKGWGNYWLDPFSREMGDSGKYFKRDVAEAKRLISAAGFPNGLNTTFYGPTGTPYGVNYQRNNETIAAMMGDGGINVNFRTVDYSSDYVPNYNYNQAFDGISVFVNTTYGGVANNLRTNFHSESSQDRSPYAPAKIGQPPGGPRDTVLDGKIEALLRESNLDRAVSQTHDIMKHLASVMYTVPFSYKARGLGAAWPWVGNWGAYRGWVITSAPTDIYPFYWYDQSKRRS
jgi:peptide/nickel transport system substrate-binding protein